MVVVLTENAAGSPIMQEEIGFALGQDKLVIPLVTPTVAQNPAALCKRPAQAGFFVPRPKVYPSWYEGDGIQWAGSGLGSQPDRGGSCPSSTWDLRACGYEILLSSSTGVLIRSCSSVSRARSER